MAMSDSHQLSSASQHSKLPNGSDFLGDVPGIQDFVAKREADFSAWTSLIAEIEQMSTVDVEKLCMVYDAFLAEFPLCYGYWKKYADHEAHLCNIDKVAEIHERAVQSAAYSVGLWLEYCRFGMLSFEDPVDVQRLFERAISFVGKDYLCHSLWDKYIEFAFSQGNWSSVAHIYIRTLQFPTKKLHGYYDSFKKFSAILGEEIECPNNNDIAVQSEMVHNCEVTNVAAFENAAITSIIKDLLDPAVDRSQALQKYLSIGEHFYQEACKMNAKICCFETHIRRPFFHVKPLDVSQLENWHRYLDFVEMQGDFDWTVKLYERCLISCANYSEFWMRYVDHMEIKGGREIASFALLRATQIFLKSVPVIHLFCARYKEQIRDISSARAALLQCDSGLDFDFVENVIKKANMEKRVGNLGAAYSIYERALEIAAEKQKENILSMLYVHFSRFKFTVTGSIDAARDILIMGIQHMPHCKLLLEGLINFELMHGGPKLMSVVDSYVANAISPSSEVSQGLNIKDREDISSLYLKFVDLCGTIHDIRMAWKRHIKLFPNLVRSNFMFKPTDSGYHALKTTIEGRQGKPVALPENTSGDDSSHGLIKHSPCNQKLMLPKSPVIHSDIAVADKSEQPNDIRQEELQQISPEVLKQSGEGASKQIRGDHDLAHKVANDTEVVQASGEHIEANEVKKMPEHERDSEDNLGQPSLENLSINPQNDEPEISVLPTLRDSEGFRETPTSSGGRSENDGNGLSSSSNPTNIGSVKSLSDHVETGSSPLCTSDPNHPSTLADPHSPSSNNVVFDEDAIQERKRHQVNHSGQAPGNPSSGFSGYPQTQQPQQWQVSPQPPHQTAEVQSQMLMNQGYPHQPVSWQTPQVQQGKPQNQHQMAAAGVPLTGSHVLSGGNMQQTFPSAPESQPVQPVSYSQAQIYPYPLSSGMQFGHVQSSQTYNPQMWNYYYQQQLQQQQYYQQPQQQQHYVQPPQHHQLQQQQPQQQYQQLQHQQQQQYQQQLQYQQLHQQQQVQQNYQQLHNQQQQIMQQRPQQQQQQLQVQAWNSSYYQQGQLPSQPNTGASGPAAYPYPQQQASPN